MENLIRTYKKETLEVIRDAFIVKGAIAREMAVAELARREDLARKAETEPNKCPELSRGFH